MAEEKPRLEIELVLDDGSVKKAFVNVENQSKKTASSMSDNFSFLTKNIAGLGAVVTAAFSFKRGISEAIDAERASLKFSQALANIGKFSDDATARFDNFSATIERNTGVDADNIKELSTSFISLGGLSGDALERATKAAVDFSAGTGKDLSTAFDMLSKASGGSTAALGRYGIKISENIPQSQRFAEALKIIESRYGGLSEQLGSNTFEGALNRVNAQFGNILETFGKLTTESPVIRLTLNTIADAFDRINKFLQTAFDTKSMEEFRVEVLTVASTFTQTLFPVLEVFFKGFQTGLGTIKLAFQTSVLGWINILEFFVRKAEPILGLLFDKDTVSGLVGGLGVAIEEQTKKIEGTFTELSAASEKTFNFEISQSVGAFLEDYKLKLSQIGEENNKLKINNADMAASIKNDYFTIGMAFNSFVSGFTNAASEFANNAKVNFEAVGKAAFMSIGQGVGSAFAAAGKALAKGENVISAFLNSLVAAFGQAAIQLGTQFILQGIAYLWAGMPNGAGLIAAGSALATFGGILSALGGGGGSAAQSPSASAGGIAASPSPTTELTPAEQLQEPQTAVSLVVNGDVYDSDGTGERIANLLSDAFDKKGVVVRQGAFA
jgi:hypothetical protein